jgi:hypothetical protein
VNWYVRALLRQATLPTARLNRDYIEAVRWLLEKRQVAGQHRFFDQSYRKQEQANAHLEAWGGRLILLVLIATVGYLIAAGIAAALHAHFFEGKVEGAAPWIMVVGALFPAAAAALSAINSHGEYAQNALRYRGMASALADVRRELAEYGGRLDQDLTPGYHDIVRLAVTTTAYLLEELYQWRTILQMKNLERS